MTAYSDLKQHLSKAIELKRLGVQIFLFAVGPCIKDGIKDMLSVVSYPPEKFLHRVRSFRAFLLIIEMVVERICPGKFIVPGKKAPTSRIERNYNFYDFLLVCYEKSHPQRFFAASLLFSLTCPYNNHQFCVIFVKIVIFFVCLGVGVAQ